MKRYCAKCGKELKAPYTHLIDNGIYLASESWHHIFLCNLCWNYMLDWIQEDKIPPNKNKKNLKED